MKATLRIKQLCVQVQASRKKLVESLTFELLPGIPLCILGETGAGKSLLAQAILGNLPADLTTNGEVWIHDQEWGQNLQNDRRSLWGNTLTLLPQEPWLALDPTMKSFSQLEETYRFVKELPPQQATKVTIQAFKNLGLTHSEKKLPNQLSGGMAQRLAFACTVAGGAQILLVDEPTKGLDIVRRDDLIQILHQFVDQQGSLLTITHDVEVVKQLGGNTIVMKEGKVQEYGETAQIFKQPKSSYTQRLIAASPKNWSRSKTFSSINPSPIVQANQLSMNRGGQQLFSDFSLTIMARQIIGVTGPSGSGKSTLGDLLLGLLQPDLGEITHSPHWKSHQFLKLYQDPPSAFSPFWKLKDLLDDLVRLHQLNTDEIDPLLKQLKLNHDILNRKPDAISGGELQRFAIFRSLLLKPVFLFADEPTSRLAPITQQEIIELLCTLAREKNCALLLVSHDLSLIQNTCDHVIEL